MGPSIFDKEDYSLKKRIERAASEEQEFVKTSNIINFKQLRADQVRTQIKSEFLQKKTQENRKKAVSEQTRNRILRGIS